MSSTHCLSSLLYSWTLQNMVQSLNLKWFIQKVFFYNKHEKCFTPEKYQSKFRTFFKTKKLLQSWHSRSSSLISCQLFHNWHQATIIMHKYFVSHLNESILNWTCSCQLHLNPIVWKNDLVLWLKWWRCSTSLPVDEMTWWYEILLWPITLQLLDCDARWQQHHLPLRQPQRTRGTDQGPRRGFKIIFLATDAAEK